MGSWGTPAASDDGTTWFADAPLGLQSTAMEGGCEVWWEDGVLMELFWGVPEDDWACRSIATAAAVDSGPDTEETEELFGAEGFGEISFDGDEIDMITCQFVELCEIVVEYGSYENALTTQHNNLIIQIYFKLWYTFRSTVRYIDVHFLIVFTSTQQLILSTIYHLMCVFLYD